MLRVGTSEDSKIIKEFMEALIKDSPYTAMFTDYTVTDNMINLYTNPKTVNEKICVLVAEEDKDIGIGVFDTIPWLYNDANIRLARLAYIYIKPEFRKKGYIDEIYTAFEYWGKEVGANWYFCGHKKTGYTKVEEVYMKEIK